MTDPIRLAETRNLREFAEASANADMIALTRRLGREAIDRTEKLIASREAEIRFSPSPLHKSLGLA